MELFSMGIAYDLQTLFEARREEFEVVDRQPNSANLYRIYEELANILYPIQFDKEGRKHNLIRLIIYKANYSARFVEPLPCTTRPAIYNELIAEGATSVIRAKA